MDGMTNEVEIKSYRQEKSMKLFESYKDLVDKTFEVIDKDLLQERLDGDDEKETEQKYLDAIKKRRIALDEVDVMLDKIEKLEKSMRAVSDEESEMATPENYAKRYAARKNKSE